MTGVQSLVTLAFGASSCLYKDLLQCHPTVTASELRKAYHRRALVFHPDKQQQQLNTTSTSSTQEHIQESTLCFQAISAAYELLRDPKRRAIYDATGQIDDDKNDGGGGCSSYSHPNSSTKDNGKDQEDHWVQFFKSVFSELITADHDEASYRGSDREATDILRLYDLCKGNLDKVLLCVVCGEERDKARWAREILVPAIQRGEIPKYASFVRTSGIQHDAVGGGLVDTDEDDDKTHKNDKKKPRMRNEARESKFPKDSGDDALVDTDDEDNERNVVAKKKVTKQPKDRELMSKKDKMEYRIAKKQKEKKEKQLELAKLIKDKRWTGDVGIGKRYSRPGTFHESLISSWENKYSSATENSDTRERPAVVVKKKRRRR